LAEICWSWRNDITGNSFGAAYYYYFYDWEISTGGCPKPTGSITIYNSGVNVSAAFTSTNGTPTSSNLTVSFDASSSTGATSYAWDFGDGNTGSGMNAQNVYNANGSYNVRLITSGPCGVDTITNTVVIQGISLEENPLSKSLEVYPNPTTGDVSVEFDLLGNSAADIRVTDMRGRVIKELGYDHLNTRFSGTVSLTGLAKGIYTIEIQSGQLKAYRRISLQ
jgi:PKD repeat protein